MFSFELMDDEMEVSYEYDLKCMTDNGEECFGLCDVESKLCEISGLVPARQHDIAMSVCFRPSSVPICGKASETIVDWTLPMGKFVFMSSPCINH